MKKFINRYETKGKDYTAVMGDFNAVVEEGKEDGYVDHYGLGYRNDYRQMLIDFCKGRQMYIDNFYSGQKTSIHVDIAWRDRKVGLSDRYILTKPSVDTAIVCVMYPAADDDSDHNSVVAKLAVKLKKVLKATVRKHWHLERMKDEGTAMNYRCDIDTV